MQLPDDPIATIQWPVFEYDRSPGHMEGHWRRGIKNDMPAIKPYRYRAKERERDAEIAAIVTAIRQQAAANIASQDALMAREWPRKGAQ